MREAIREARRTMASVPGAVVTPTRMRSWVSHTTPLRWLPEVLEELLLGLVGQEAQGQLPERDQVVGAEVVGERLGDPLGRVDVAVDHPAAELFG